MTTKLLKGKVISVARDKTITILITKKAKHRALGKSYNKSKKVHAHDENNRAVLGQEVWIKSCRPLSKQKSFILTSSTKQKSS